MSGEVILVVDDDRSVVRLMKLYLTNSGYYVEVAQRTREALTKLADSKPDLIILDLAVSGTDGFELCERIRQSSDVPIIILSARSGDADRIASLELGADDFVAKPFNPRELVARVRAVLRRTLAPARSQRVILVGDVLVDTLRHEVAVDGRPIKLRAKEYGVLEVLASRPGAVVPREQILRSVWGEDFVGDDRTLTVHVAWLRAKLSNSSVQLHALRGVGYRLTVN
jgi:DNA-binding response OmpR family regulator